MDYGERISYLVLESGADVVSSDGEVVGKVEHVLIDEHENVFDGIVIDIERGPGGHRFVDADQVADVYERALVVTVSAAEVDALPKPSPSPGVIENHGVEDSASPLQNKLRRAWDRISGNY